jgi:hypothetical protein
MKNGGPEAKQRAESRKQKAEIGNVLVGLATGDSRLGATGHVQLLGGSSRRSSGLFVGERLDCPAGPGLRAVRAMRCLVGQGEGELVAIGGSRGVVGLELGGFALECGVEGGELRERTEKLKS